jgi:hypothetical protein
MKRKFKITQAHIINGRGGDCCLCPVALAIKEDRLFKKGGIQVSNFFVAFPNDKQAVLPRHVQKFIKDFDAGREVKPATFTLTIKKL